MATQQVKEELITALASAVGETLSYFEGAGQSTGARVDRWGAWDILAHFSYYHYAAAWGIVSASAGGPPWQMSGDPDQRNQVCLQLHEGESFAQLIGQLRQAQERLVRATRNTRDLDAPAFLNAEGNLVSVRQLLVIFARHWRGHLQALREAGR